MKGWWMVCVRTRCCRCLEIRCGSCSCTISDLSPMFLYKTPSPDPAYAPKGTQGTPTMGLAQYALGGGDIDNRAILSIAHASHVCESVLLFSSIRNIPHSFCCLCIKCSETSPKSSYRVDKRKTNRHGTTLWTQYLSAVDGCLFR